MTPNSQMNMNSGIRGLPQTIEGARSRYLNVYKEHFKGPRSEMKRLRNLADAKILKLRRKAPNFYSGKLPKFVNQVASLLLTCDTRSEQGQMKFNETHQHFLRILDGFTKSQPADEADFTKELDKEQTRKDLLKRQLELRKKISEFEACEFDLEDLGEEDDETPYTKRLAQNEKDCEELQQVSTMILHMEGENVEERPEFKFKITKGSMLQRLTPEQINMFEEQILKFLETNKKRNLFVDNTVIEGMIAQLKIDPERFNNQQMRDLVKDSLDAYKSFFRELDKERRKAYYDELISKPHLRPREGIIIEDPDDVSEDVKRRFEDHQRTYQHEIERLESEFEELQKRSVETHNTEDEAVDECEDDEKGPESELKKFMITNKHMFVRVKEEPLYDYDNSESADEEMDETESSGNQVSPNPSSPLLAEDLEDIQNGTPGSEDATGEEEDENDICMGTVEPRAKVEVIEILDDDDD